MYKQCIPKDFNITRIYYLQNSHENILKMFNVTHQGFRFILVRDVVTIL